MNWRRYPRVYPAFLVIGPLRAAHGASRLGVAETNTLVPADELSQQRHERRFLIGKQWRALVHLPSSGSLVRDVLVSLVEDWWSNESYSRRIPGSPSGVLHRLETATHDFWQPLSPERTRHLHDWNRVPALRSRQVRRGILRHRISLILVVAGLVWTFWGKNRLRHLAFPLLLVVSVIPLPVIVYTAWQPRCNFWHPTSPRVRPSSSRLRCTATGISYNWRPHRWVLPRHAAVSGRWGLLPSGRCCSASGALRHLDSCRPVCALDSDRNSFQCDTGDRNGAPGRARSGSGDGFYHSLSGWLIFVAGFGTLLLCTKILKYLLNRNQGALRA